MHQTKQIFLAALVLTAFTGCTPGAPDSAYLNRGTPESLLDVSSEVVNLSVATKADTKALATWIGKDAPTRAQLFCNEQAPSCMDARRILAANHVAVTISPSANSTVTLYYERVLAHDCSSRYTDPWEHWDNANPPSFGCASAANIVQQVSDKHAFINPNLSDDPSAVGAVNAIQRANAPKQGLDPKYGVSDSIVKSSGSGGSN